MFEIGARVIALVLGYFAGTLPTGYLYGKSKGIDIRDHGSGNSGTTNTLRILGWKAGAVTFLGDSFKAILIILLVHFIFKDRCSEYVRLLDLYAGFGAVLGHNFPFFLKFKGGKGIATTAGVILAVCPLGVPVSIILFVTTVLITRYVSLGSILVVLAFLIQTIIFNYNGLINIDPAYVLEFDIVVACFTVMAIWRHRANISRLLNGTENKFGQKAK